MTEKKMNMEQGHWVLAKLGKRVLRPGGRELTAQMLRQFGIRICLEKFQLPSLFNAHGQCLGLILEETVCSQCRTEIHEEVMYGAMA